MICTNLFGLVLGCNYLLVQEYVMILGLGVKLAQYMHPYGKYSTLAVEPRFHDLRYWV
jgi:hypothetical protein